MRFDSSKADGLKVISAQTLLNQIVRKTFHIPGLVFDEVSKLKSEGKWEGKNNIRGLL